MEEISNRTLAILLIGAIVISLGGTLVSLNKLGKMKAVTITGLGTGDVNQTAGNVSLQVQDVTWINFTLATCYFGTGYVLGTKTCDINSSGWENDTAAGGDCSSEWDASNTCTDGFELKNIGNNNVTLNISFAQSGTNFLGDASGKLFYKMANGTEAAGATEGCRVGLLPQTWCEVTADDYSNITCSDFTYSANNNYVHFNVKVSFTQAATVGYKSQLITAYGKAI